MEGVKLNGTLVGARKILNFIEGTGIDITVGGQDDAGSNEVDITIDNTATFDGTVSGTGKTALNFTDTTTTTGLTIGVDTNLYRDSANVLRTDDSFQVSNTAFVASNGSYRGSYLEAYNSSGTYLDMASATSMTFVARTATTNIVMAVKGMASQTGTLQEWRNSSDAILASITASGNIRQLVGAVGATGTTETIAIANGDVQTFTVDGDCVFTMPTGLTSGQAYSLTCILTDSGGPNDITFTGVKWSGGNNPTIMSAASAVDIFTFTTIDGGTTWYGFIAGQGMAT